MKYINTPSLISYKDIKSNNCSLSSSQYKRLISSNANLVKTSKFLDEKLTKKHLGSEIGSSNYIKKSSHYFMRTKALQDYSFIPEITSESFVPMLPQEFQGKGIERGDIIISKDSNIGEIVIADKNYHNVMLSGALYNLPIKNNYREYVLALVKHDFFREQLDVMVPKSATIRHAKTMFLDCLIPKPTKKDVCIIKLLVESIIAREVTINELYEKTIMAIEDEIENNNNNSVFSFKYPSYSKIAKTTRLDTGLYRREFKEVEHKIKNYKHGFSTIYNLDMELSRGQNLQVSNIGRSIYSDEYHNGFYKLILPKYLSIYGTYNNISYLGNENDLKALEKGDLIFGAEGSGRSFVVVDDMKNTITNIHGITIKQTGVHNLYKGIFVKQMLDYYRHCGLIDMMAVGGHGGSLAQRYWDDIFFPNFPDKKKKEISLYYFNENVLDEIKLNVENEEDLKKWLTKEKDYLKAAGILNLDKTAKKLKKILNEYIDGIVN